MKNKMCNLVGVTVFYNPDEENVDNCIMNSKVVDFMIVVVNGENSNLCDRLSCCSNIHVLFMGYNSGIAKATNDGIRWLNANIEYQYCCFLDQDSKLPEHYTLLIDQYSKLASTNIKVGIVAPAYVNPRTGIESVNTKFNKFSFSRRKIINELEETTAPIASGSLVSYSLLEDIGLLEEQLFIDYVDVEFAFRAVVRGYKNYVSSKVKISHELGEQQIKKLLFLKVKPSFHSAIRKYYISRNRLFFISKYFINFPSIILFEFLAVGLDFLRIVMYEDDKLNKIRHMLLGFFHFFKSSYGPLK